jgi:hypothetical protein
MGGCDHNADQLIEDNRTVYPPGSDGYTFFFQSDDADIEIIIDYGFNEANVSWSFVEAHN